MPAKMMIAALALVALLPWRMAAAEQDNKVPARADFLTTKVFSWEALAAPESLFWPGYFWAWNGPLAADVLRGQLANMAAHDARSVCTLPMPHEFRPTIMNNQMDVDYLSPEFFTRVKIAVDEAARLRMNYWLYDEGGWPSGQAAGRVLKARPEMATRVLQCDANGKWSPRREQRADLLNPHTAETFLKLTHERYADAVGAHLGSTVKLAFTDEPAYRAPQVGRTIPWPDGADEVFRRRFGYDVLEKLDAMRVAKPQDLSPQQKQVRIDLFDFWSGQFRDAYFLPLRDWSRKHGMAQAGHLGGEDETLGAVRYGYGHVMRQLRALDVPGVDVIWRQVFPGKANHHFPKFASSAAHQNGTALAFTESFCVYGDGLTPAQMKWIVDYQYVRGLTLLVCGLYPLSTRDHLMTFERPHFGASSPLADFLPDFHRYVARLGYTLACGQPAVEIGLYYPVRDLWASGDASDPALRGHDALAHALLQRQCDFDVVDDDVLADPAARLENGRLAIGPMRYRTIVLGPTRWMTEAAQRQLKALQSVGGQVVRVEDLDQVDAALAAVAPTVKLDPPSPDLRVLMRRWRGGGAAFLFNEGSNAYHGSASLALEGKLHEVEPAADTVRAVDAAGSSAGQQTVPLTLAVGESMLWVAGPQEKPTQPAPPAARKVVRSLGLADGWRARIERQYVVGEHDYEVRPFSQAEFKPVALGPWAAALGLGKDFSGHATYRRTIRVPGSWPGGRLCLDLGGVEYAARVSIDHRPIGCVLWSPWRIELPPLKDRHEFVLEIEVSNTLANELTSARVREAWAKRTGPGWPSCYHQRALEFEMDSRGGGLLGPVRLELATP